MSFQDELRAAELKSKKQGLSESERMKILDEAGQDIETLKKKIKENVQNGFVTGGKNGEKKRSGAWLGKKDFWYGRHYFKFEETREKARRRRLFSSAPEMMYVTDCVVTDKEKYKVYYDELMRQAKENGITIRILCPARDEIQEGEECLVGRPALSDNSYVGGEYDIIYKRNKPRYKKGDVPVPGRIGVTNLRFIKNVEIVNGGIYLSGTVEF